jgi:hypothetical protein
VITNAAIITGNDKRGKAGVIIGWSVCSEIKVRQDFRIYKINRINPVNPENLASPVY